MAYEHLPRICFTPPKSSVNAVKWTPDIENSPKLRTRVQLFFGAKDEAVFSGSPFSYSTSVIAFGRCLGFSDFGGNYVVSGHGLYTHSAVCNRVVLDWRI